jgi:hypothetical protein
LGIEYISDAVNRSEWRQVDLVFLAEFAELHDILVERTAADIGVQTPD